LIKKTSDAKSGNPKNAKELLKKTSDKKRGNPKNANRLIKKTSDKKRGNLKMQWADQKDLRCKKRQPQKNTT
jgi:hypothetical protein